MTASIVVTKKRAVVAASVGSNQSIFCGSSHGPVGPGEGLGAEDFAHSSSFTTLVKLTLLYNDYRGIVLDTILSIV